MQSDALCGKSRTPDPEFLLFSLLAQDAPSKLGDGLEPDIRKATVGDAGHQEQQAQDVNERLRNIEVTMKQLLAKHDETAGGNAESSSCLGSPPPPDGLPIYQSTPAPDVEVPNQGSSIVTDILGDLVFWKDPEDRSRSTQ